MTDEETTYWENCGWKCILEGCDGLLELVDDRDEPRERPGVVEPIVQCYECGMVYDVRFEPREEGSDD